MKILFVTPECAPLVKTGGLGDVSAALPAALHQQGCDVAVLMPAYADMHIGGVLERTIALPSVGRWPAAQLLKVRPASGPPLFLLSCPGLYGGAGTPYAQPGDPQGHVQALRFGLLAHAAAVLGSSDTPLGWQADIVHANDWPCGLAPLYLHQRRASGQKPVALSVMTIHNLAFQGLFPMAAADMLDVAQEHRGVQGVEFWGKLSMLKAGLQFAHAITTVSPTYAAEIQQPHLGFGLDGVLRERSDRLFGLLNGIDTAVWNPRCDPLIAAPFSADQLDAKALNKKALRQRCGLRPSDGPLLGMVGRLTAQKGVDFVLAAADGLIERGAQLVVLGSGDAELETALSALAASHPGAVHVTLGFDETLAHQIEAGADCFLMPSRFEPCGLNQMYSQVYGTPPVVSRTGGLADTVTNVDAGLTAGTGFVMPSLAQSGFNAAMDGVLAAWRKPARWAALQKRCMAQDFGWGQAARPYIDLYTDMLAGRLDRARA